MWVTESGEASGWDGSPGIRGPLGRVRDYSTALWCDIGETINEQALLAASLQGNLLGLTSNRTKLIW